jgi:hypothetical protein
VLTVEGGEVARIVGRQYMTMAIDGYLLFKDAVFCKKKTICVSACYNAITCAIGN